MTVHRGVGASDGIAVGPAVVIDHRAVVIDEPENPVAALSDALKAVQRRLTELSEAAAAAQRNKAAEVLVAQALMATDPMLRDGILGRIESGTRLADAIDETEAEIAAMFAAIENPYIAARADDVAEVADRVRRVLAGVGEADLSSISEPSVVVARAITVAETVQLDPGTAQFDPGMVLGFATETGGSSSHVAIVATEIGIAAVVGVASIASAVSPGTTVALDGSSGEVVVAPDESVLADYEHRRAAHAAVLAAAERHKGQPVMMGDAEISVAANIGSQSDLERAMAEQAEGIGLFRTEFLFLDRSEPPSEAEQLEIYSAAARSFAHPVVIRAFDIGGDKPAAYISVPDEENPFLGVRGARVYGIERELFETQIRAVARAAAEGDLWLMLPMISTVAEVVEIAAIVDEVIERLAEDGVAHRRPCLGVMIEVPSVALIADAVACHVDFFSIGTNDLTQYTFAADRGNEALGHLQDPLHPSVLALCMFAAAAARRAQIPVSVCGLAAADPAGAALFAAMGIDKLSVSTSLVNRTKAVLAGIDHEKMDEALETALAAADAAQVRAAAAALLDSKPSSLDTGTVHTKDTADAEDDTRPRPSAEDAGARQVSPGDVSAQDAAAQP